MASRELSQAVSGASLPAHTPGPWYLAFTCDGGFHVECADKNIICRRGPWSHNAERSNANAHLIAAAPDLLSAARTMLALVMLKYGNLDADVNVATDAARTAIAKALGEDIADTTEPLATPGRTSK